jgi:DNA-binding NarL/FixJ family response regulator
MTTAPDERIRVLIVHSHTVVRTGLALLLQQRPTFEVVGQSSDCGEAIALAAERQPHIILVEIAPIASERLLDLQRLAACARTRLIALAGSEATDTPVRAVRLGAVGLLRKDAAVDVIVKAIEKVFRGEVWFDRRTIASILEEIADEGEEVRAVAAPEAASLTRREREVIELLAQGMKNKQIAQGLYISEVTVRHHLTSVFGKLGVCNRAELITYAYASGLAGDRLDSRRLRPPALAS